MIREGSSRQGEGSAWGLPSEVSTRGWVAGRNMERGHFPPVWKWAKDFEHTKKQRWNLNERAPLAFASLSNWEALRVLTSLSLPIPTPEVTLPWMPTQDPSFTNHVWLKTQLLVIFKEQCQVIRAHILKYGTNTSAYMCMYMHSCASVFITRRLSGRK